VPDLTDAQLDDLMAAIGLTKRRSGPPPSAPCGTATAYSRHLRYGEEPCQPCRDANAAKSREEHARGAVRTDLPPIKHGTPQGARQHWYRKVPICEPCRQAFNTDQTRRRRERAARGGGR
jgi:hypothetical protein